MYKLPNKSHPQQFIHHVNKSTGIKAGSVVDSASVVPYSRCSVFPGFLKVYLNDVQYK